MPTGKGVSMRFRTVYRYAAGALILLAGGGAIALALWPHPPKLHLTFAAFLPGRIYDGVPAIGTVHADRTVEVGAEASGRIAEVLVEVNDNVTAGQVLARFEPAPLAAAVARAEAARADAAGALALAQSQLAAAERTLARTGTLRAQGLSPQARLDDDDARRREAAIAVERAQAGLREAEQALAEAKRIQALGVVKSPIDGFVQERRISPGQTVNAAFSTPVLFTIASDIRQVEVEGQVAEADVARIRTGMRALVHVQAYPNVTFEGKVMRLDRSPHIVGRAVTYPAVIAVKDDAARLLPGMTANIELANVEASDVFTLPISALTIYSDYLDYVSPLSAEKINALRAEEPENTVPAIYGTEIGGYFKRDLQRVLVKRGKKVFVAPVRPGVQDQRNFEAIVPEQGVFPNEVKLKPGDQVLVSVETRP